MNPPIFDHPYVVKRVHAEVRAHLRRIQPTFTGFYDDDTAQRFVELLALVFDPFSIRSYSYELYHSLDNSLAFQFDGSQATGWLYRPELYTRCTAMYTRTNERRLLTSPVSVLNGYLGTLSPITHNIDVPEADLVVGLENAARKPFRMPWYLVMGVREYRGGTRYEKAVRRNPSPDDPKHLYPYSLEWIFHSGGRPPCFPQFLPRYPQLHILLPTCRAALAHLHSLSVEEQRRVFVMDHRYRTFNEWQRTPEFSMLPPHVRRICQFSCFEQVQANIPRSVQRKTDPLRKWSKMTPHTAR